MHEGINITETPDGLLTMSGRQMRDVTLHVVYVDSSLETSSSRTHSLKTEEFVRVVNAKGYEVCVLDEKARPKVDLIVLHKR